MVKRVFFFRPTLDDGGADRVTLTLLQNLDRARFRPTLVLVHRRGALMAELPPDVPVIDHESAFEAGLTLILEDLTHHTRTDTPPMHLRAGLDDAFRHVDLRHDDRIAGVDH